MKKSLQREIIASNLEKTNIDLQKLIEKKTGKLLSLSHIRVMKSREKMIKPQTILHQRLTDQHKKEEDKNTKKLTEHLMIENQRLEKELSASLQLKMGINPNEFNLVESNGESESVAVAILSDMHIDEIVDPRTVNGMNTFNLKIAESRMTQFFQRTVKLLKKEQNQTEIRTLILGCLGDAISSNIHEELLENTQLRPIEAMIMAENLIISGINYILKNSDVNIIFVGHSGNHVRLTRKVHISTEKGNSLETFMYHHIKNHFAKNKRIEFKIADGYLSYITLFERYTICFQHGHAVRYAGGVGGISICLNKAIAQWEKLRHADLYVLGHWHQLVDGGNFIVNGSIIGYNAFALFIKASYEPPKQAFFLINKKYMTKTVMTPILFD